MQNSGMKMTRDYDSKIDLVDNLLAEARAEQLDLPSGLAERVVAQAHAMQPRHQRKRAWLWPAFSDVFKVWPALGGLVAASCVGFWIGINPPDGMIDAGNLLLLPSGVIYDDAAEVSGFGWDLQEG